MYYCQESMDLSDNIDVLDKKYVKCIKFLFIRHAESTMNNRPEYICGQSNGIPITELGAKQAEALGKMFHKTGKKFDLVFSSPAIRAYDTSVVCLNNMDTNLITWTSELLLERSQGDWTYCNKREIYTPEILAEIKQDPLNFKPPNGESMLDVSDRILKFFNQEIFNHYIIEKSSNKEITIAIFTHGFVIKCLLQHILNSDPSMTWKFEIDNTSVTEIWYDHNGWHFVKMNDTGHYFLIDNNSPAKESNSEIDFCTIHHCRSFEELLAHYGDVLLIR